MSSRPSWSCPTGGRYADRRSAGCAATQTNKREAQSKTISLPILRLSRRTVCLWTKGSTLCATFAVEISVDPVPRSVSDTRGISWILKRGYSLSEFRRSLVMVLTGSLHIQSERYWRRAIARRSGGHSKRVASRKIRGLASNGARPNRPTSFFRSGSASFSRRSLRRKIFAPTAKADRVRRIACGIRISAYG
jgi:hypothetical protein